jgi:hypothetical protein
MGSAAIGSIGFAFEPTATPGEQDGFFLAYSAVAATSSAANQPTGSSGMRAHIRVYGNTATGTVTIVGKDINGNALTETTPTIPIFNSALNSQEQAAFDYVTVGVYSAINSSGITTTGLTNGFVKISAIVAARYLLPATAKIVPKFGEFSPNEHRALPDLNTKKIQTVEDVSVDLETTLYPNGSLWSMYSIMNSVTNPGTPTSSPGSPTSLLTTTAVSGSPLSLTTPPTFPGMKLVYVVTSASVAGTIATTGTDIFTGETVTDTIVASGNGTYYSNYTFTSVQASGIVVTGLTSGSIAVTGVFGYNRSFFPSINPFSLTTEWYTGTDSVCVPLTSFEELGLDFDVEKEFKLSAKGLGQWYLPIGSRLTNPMTASRVVSLAQPLDYPQAAWACQVCIDPLTNSPGTTQFGDMLSGKFTIKSPNKGIHKLTNRQTISTVYRKKVSIAVEAKIDYTNVIQWENFRQDIKQYVQFNFYGRNVGGGNIQTIQVIIPFKFNKFEVTSTPDADFAQADIAGIGEYDGGIGASWQVNWLNSYQAPNYTS